MKAALIALWRLFYAFAFYPIMIGLFIWIYVTGRHWVFGLAVIAAILILDPIWRVLARSILRLGKRAKR